MGFPFYALGVSKGTKTQKTNLRLLLISRKELEFYDRRDVHTRNLVTELSLIGLTIEELNLWLNDFSEGPISAEEIHSVTGGHPLAVELLEMYGQTVHGDWLRFLDEEILNVLPKAEYELLAILANSKMFLRLFICQSYSESG